MNEFDVKVQRIQNLLHAHSLDALLLQRVDNFAWATSGASSFIDIASTNGVASLLFTPSGRYLIADNIEAPRLRGEEGLEAQGWEFRIGSWFEPGQAVSALTSGLRLGADGSYPGATDLSASFPAIRAALTPEEGERFRALGKLCAAAMDAAVRSVHPGMTEYEIAARLADEALQRGMQPTVNLIATDERIFRVRHPLPTDKRLDKYAMLVLCGRKAGLVCSITRLIHFGPLPDELRVKSAAVARVDAHFIAATRPGRTLGDIFRQAGDAYEAAGYPGEWRLHHQGGPAGYMPREFIATPTSQSQVSQGQVYAWNPSITGTKSEDTVLIGQADNEVLTAISGWPSIKVELDGCVYERPAILEVD